MQTEQITFSGFEPLKMFAIPDSLYEGITGDKLNTIFSNTIVKEAEAEVPDQYKLVLYGITVNGIVTTDNIKTYLTNLNGLAEDGLIEYGCLSKPFIMPLALIHTSPRSVLIFYGYSQYTTDQLNEKLGTKSFQSDGELPNTTLQGIPYYQQLGWNVSTKMGEIANIIVKEHDANIDAELQTTEEQDVIKAVYDLINEIREMLESKQSIEIINNSIGDLDKAVKDKLAQIIETGMKATEENSDMPGYDRKSISMEEVLWAGVKIGQSVIQPMALMSVEDHRQYIVNSRWGYTCCTIQIEPGESADSIYSRLQKIHREDKELTEDQTAVVNIFRL